MAWFDRAQGSRFASGSHRVWSFGSPPFFTDWLLRYQTRKKPWNTSRGATKQLEDLLPRHRYEPWHVDVHVRILSKTDLIFRFHFGLIMNTAYVSYYPNRKRFSAPADCEPDPSHTEILYEITRFCTRIQMKTHPKYWSLPGAMQNNMHTVVHTHLNCVMSKGSRLRGYQVCNLLMH